MNGFACGKSSAESAQLGGNREKLVPLRECPSVNFSLITVDIR